MGDYSPKKQLPLRQQTDRPTLKFIEQSTPLRPVHLFSRDDIKSLKYGITPPLQKEFSSRNSVINVESVRNATTSRLGNHPADPYSQPFTVKQAEQTLVSSAPTVQRDFTERRRWYDAAPRESRLLPDNNRPSGVPTFVEVVPGGSVVQKNSFMRPISAMRKDDLAVQNKVVNEKHDEFLYDNANNFNSNRNGDVTHSRSFVLFQKESFTDNDANIRPSTSAVNIIRSESVNKSLRRPLSATMTSATMPSPTKTESVPATESVPLKSILKMRKDAPYSSVNDAALKRHVIKSTITLVPTSQFSTRSDDSRKNTVSLNRTISTRIDSSPNSITKNNSCLEKDVENLRIDAGDSQALQMKQSPVKRPSTPLSTNTTTSTSSFSENSSPTMASTRTVMGRASPPVSWPSHGSSWLPSSPTVRNPRYTPTKPYDEVKDPTSPVSRLPPTDPQQDYTSSCADAPDQVNNDGDRTQSEQRPNCDGVSGEISVKDPPRPNIDGSEVASNSPHTCERVQGDGQSSQDDDTDDDTEEDSEDETTTDDTGAEVGTTSNDDALGDEDDCVEDMDDDVVQFSADDSDGVSITSSLSYTRSAAYRRAISRSNSDSSVGSRKPPLPGLVPSLFWGVPPTIRFVNHDERVETLPWDIRRMLKWRLSPITPNIVKSTVARSGFRITKRNYDWIGCWGRHMKATCFKSIRDYQKINHFPGTFQIGRKDRLWRNLYKLQLQFGKTDFGFFPQTFVLPSDNKLLKRAWDETSKLKWIVKPPASARGIGIKVIHKWAQIPKRRPIIVQRYLHKPYLINESKFDLRIYVYVTSYDPLRIYIFEDGLVRFASQKYSSSMKNLSNKYMHLTNYSINKWNNGYQSNADENVCQGHKWGLKALWGFLQAKGVNTTDLWENIQDVIIKCIISAESAINSQVKSSVRRRYSVHELFGFDVFLDDKLKPWVIEVNISPSLHSNSALDINIKGSMIKDLMNLAGFMIPDKRDVVSNSNLSSLSDTSITEPSNDTCINRQLWQQALSSDEREKHAFYVSKFADPAVNSSILDILTPDDIRMLVETVDEDSRRGQFQRVFPSPVSQRYFRYFEQPRYYNLLLDAWVRKYHRAESKGVTVLNAYCHMNLHKASPTLNPNHQWVQPSLVTAPRSQSAPTHKLRELQSRTSFQKKFDKPRVVFHPHQSSSLSRVSSIELLIGSKSCNSRTPEGNTS